MQEPPATQTDQVPAKTISMLEKLRLSLHSINKYIVVVVFFKVSLILARLIYTHAIHASIAVRYNERKYSLNKVLFIAFLIVFALTLALTVIFTYIWGKIIGKKEDKHKQIIKASIFLTVVGLPAAYTVAYACFINNKFLMAQLPEEFSKDEIISDDDGEDSGNFLPNINYFLSLCGLVAEFGAIFLVLFLGEKL